MDTIKYILFAAISATIGGAIGWFAAREWYYKDFDVEVAKIRDEYERREDEKVISDLAIRNDGIDAAVYAYDALREHYGASEKPDLSALAQKYDDKDLNRFVAERTAPEEDDGEDLDEDFDDEFEGLEPDEYLEVADSPVIISMKEYTDTKTAYDKNTLIYYVEDDVLADAADEVVTNRDELIGPDALHVFGYDPINPDTVFVRNDKIGCDYEIIKQEASYDVVVNGR